MYAQTWSQSTQRYAQNATDAHAWQTYFLFLLRDTMRKRCFCCRRVSVRHVTLVDCIQTAEDIVKLVSQPDSPIILVVWPQRRYPIPRGTPSAGAQSIHGVENFCDFRLKSPFISETVRD